MASGTVWIHKGNKDCKGQTQTVPIENGTRLRITCSGCPLDWSTPNTTSSNPQRPKR